MKIKLFNTASRKVESVIPLNPPYVSMYSCGITAYYYTHIGHLYTYITSDLLRRVLTYAGYEVRHVMNVTDVGHMTSDADEGEDKLIVGARREKKTPQEIARFYEEGFWQDTAKINILKPQTICRATEHIQDMIELIKKLEKNGYTYQTSVGVIFDTAKFAAYPNFAKLQLNKQEAGARVKVDEERKNPWDFALWVTNQPKHLMQWDSPWGRGFPGWHIECSAMSMRYLGETMDIHTGGIDHIPIHHTNEIAQSECGTGKKFVNHWTHTAFLNVDNTKMSKSLGNLYTLNDLAAKDFLPLSLRYFFLGTSYRKPINFTWEALGAAQTALVKLWKHCVSLPAPSDKLVEKYINEFESAIYDDLNMSKALAVVWKLLESKESASQIAATLFHLDKVLGLDLANAKTQLSDLENLKKENRSKKGFSLEHETQAKKLLVKRNELRKQKKYQEADVIRDQIKELGFSIEDNKAGAILKAI
jgi:cysteinyl-tRNA synthetase